MKYNIRHVWLVALLMALFQQGVFAATKEYSAMTRESSPQQGDREGRIYVGKDGVRTEYKANGEALVQIVNFRTQEVFLLDPGKRTYMRRSIAPSSGRVTGGGVQQSPPANPCEGLSGLVCKSQGVEEIQGRKAEKWSMAPADGEHAGEMTIWLDQQRHIPIRQVMPNGATMSRRLVGSETVNQRQTEKWETTVTGPDGSSNTSHQWFDASLGVNVREEQAGVYVRDLLDIRPGPQPASLFNVPGDFREIEAGQGTAEKH